MASISQFKQEIMIGIIVALVTSISTIVYNKSGVIDKQEVRISHLERDTLRLGSEIKLVSLEVGTLRVETATVVTMLSSLNQTNTQLERTTTELGKIVARLDERTKGN